MPNKYSPFLEYLLASGISISFASNFAESSNLVGFLRRLFDGFELLLWCFLNKISLNKVSFVFTHSALIDKDILFLMYYGNLTFETEEFSRDGLDLAQLLAAIDIPKVVHLTHYAYCVKSGAENLLALRPSLLVAENNLKNNSLFYNKYFSDVPGIFQCLPYVAAGRFQKIKSMPLRINKLVVTGTITYKIKSPEFIDFYAVNELQPLRRSLYQQAAQYLGHMDCLISDLDASRRSKTEALESKWRKQLKQLKRFKPTNAQKDYYKKDIVNIYNDYTMFAVPEEICDLPAIGFVEGMACGAAYLGIRSPMYEDIGMVAGVHYIDYDGTVSDLMAKVRHYQEHPNEVERIAQEGYRFVHQQLSAQSVYGAFVDRLYALAQDSGTGR